MIAYEQLAKNIENTIDFASETIKKLGSDDEKMAYEMGRLSAFAWYMDKDRELPDNYSDCDFEELMHFCEEMLGLR